MFYKTLIALGTVIAVLRAGGYSYYLWHHQGRIASTVVAIWCAGTVILAGYLIGLSD